MCHYLVTFKTSIQAYNSAPFFGQRRCDSRVQGMDALKVYGARDSFPIPLYIISGSGVASESFKMETKCAKSSNSL